MWLLALALGAEPDVAALQRSPPPGWVDLLVLIPDLHTDIVYYSEQNFTGAQLPGYGVPGAWLLEGPARALAQVEADLRQQGYGLLIFDAYRPQRATEAMVAWAWRSGNERLVKGGYISPTSFHNRGMAIDLSLVRLSDGRPLDMGTAFDDLSVASHTNNATGEVLANRNRLKEAMERHGWRNYWREWWHFSWPAAGMPDRRDVPYACYEAGEEVWAAPPGWDRPGWRQPDLWGTAPCFP